MVSRILAAVALCLIEWSHHAQAEEPAVIGVGLFYSGQQQSTTIAVGYGQAPQTIVALAPDLPVTVSPGTQLILVTGYTGDDVLSVQWFKDGRPLNNGGSAALTLSNTKGSDSGYYHAVIHRSTSDFTSHRAVIRIARSVELPLLNLSSRTTITSNNRMLISGFVIAASPGQLPDEIKTVLIRAAGPTLAKFGVTTPLSKPRVRVFDRNGIQRTPEAYNSPYNAAQLAAAVGAFAMTGPDEFQNYFNLPPGTYTLQVDSTDAGTGEVLAEIYEVPASVLYAWAHLPE